MLKNKKIRLLLSWVLDYFIPIKKNRVAFVSRPNVPVTGNLRALMDAVLDLDRFEVGVYKERGFSREFVDVMDEAGVCVFDRYSIAALVFILSSEYLVVSHSVRHAYVSRKRPGRKIMNVWHGVALKKIEAMMPFDELNELYLESRRKLIAANSKLYDVVISSGKLDRLVNSVAFSVDYSKVLELGLPRFDYLAPGYVLPRDLVDQKETVLKAINGRKFILYAPTFREVGEGAVEHFSASLELLTGFCRMRNVVIGVRPHPYDTGKFLKFCDGVNVIACDSNIVSESAILLQLADVLVVDYSSIWVDFLLVNKPIVGLWPDYDTYVDRDRGFILDYKTIFPGKVYLNWSEVTLYLEGMADSDLTDVCVRVKRDLVRSLLVPELNDIGKISSKCVELVFDRNVSE